MRQEQRAFDKIELTEELLAGASVIVGGEFDGAEPRFGSARILRSANQACTLDSEPIARYRLSGGKDGFVGALEALTGVDVDFVLRHKFASEDASKLVDRTSSSPSLDICFSALRFMGNLGKGWSALTPRFLTLINTKKLLTKERDKRISHSTSTKASDNN